MQGVVVAVVFIGIVVGVVIAIAFLINGVPSMHTSMNSAKMKGERGEARVIKSLETLHEDYFTMNDVVLRTRYGTTQIDHVVVSKYGIFVIETKNYEGKIYGDDDKEKWKQLFVNDVQYRRSWKTYTYVTKNFLYNPVRQSKGHAYHVKQLLKGYPNVPVVPMVVFAGGADLSSVRTHSCVIHKEQMIPFINQYKVPYLTDEEVLDIRTKLMHQNVREEVKDSEHVKYVREHVERNRQSVNAGICPRCGGKMVWRKGKYSSFYGCSNYPNCKYTAYN